MGIGSATTSGAFAATNNLGTGLIDGGSSATRAVTVQVSGGGTAGVNSGSLSIQYHTNGTNIDPTFTSQSANQQNIAVQATGYRMANDSATPVEVTPTVSIAARVGDVVSADRAITVTNASPDAYTEGLTVNVAGVTGNAQGNGDIVNLAAQGTSNNAILVGLADTSVAGTTTGQVNLNLVSTGAGTTNAADTSVGAASVTITGKVYQQAIAQVGATAVDFGIVHVGESVTAKSVSVKNNAQVAGLNDALKGTASAGGAFSASVGSGLDHGLGAGESTDVLVGLDTTSAGLFSDKIWLSLTSHDEDLVDLDLDPAPVGVAAQVNQYANAELENLGSGYMFAASGTVYTLDFGNLLLGTGSVTGLLAVLNDVSGYADLLKGDFGLTSGTTGFSYSGLGAVLGLGAGGHANWSLSFAPTALGLFQDQITFTSFGYNNSGYQDQTPTLLTLNVLANVVNGTSVPEPGMLALLAIALVPLVRVRRRALTLH